MYSISIQFSFLGHDQLGYESLDSVDTGASSFLIGTIGHVAHGKSTVVKAISGVQTVRFKNELVRNITIKLGYANAKVRGAYTYPTQPADRSVV